jgi:hypothetical protein
MEVLLPYVVSLIVGLDSRLPAFAFITFKFVTSLRLDSKLAQIMRLNSVVSADSTDLHHR